MSNVAELKDLIAKTEAIKPITTVNGVKVVEPSEQRDLAVLAKMTDDETLGTLELNPDGSIARTPVKYAAVNPEYYFINRYKRVKDSLYVVTDFRAIMDQQNGSIYAKQIPAHVITRDKESGNLKLDKTVMISDTEFVADYIHKLNREAMEQIVPLIANGVGVTADDLAI